MEDGTPRRSILAAQHKTPDGWQTITADEAHSVAKGAELRCQACHGRVHVYGGFWAERFYYFRHETGHKGCSYLTAQSDGIASVHPDALT